MQNMKILEQDGTSYAVSDRTRTLRDKRILCITASGGWGRGADGKGWVYCLKNYHGADTVQYSCPGAGFKKTGSAEGTHPSSSFSSMAVQAISDHAADAESFDYVILGGGATNDAKLYESYSPAIQTDLAPYITTVVTTLRATFRNAAIWIIPHGGIKNVSKIAEAIRGIYCQIGAEAGAFCSLESGGWFKGRTGYDSPLHDGTHLSEDGYKVEANYIEQTICGGVINPSMGETYTLTLNEDAGVQYGSIFKAYRNGLFYNIVGNVDVAFSDSNPETTWLFNLPNAAANGHNISFPMQVYNVTTGKHYGSFTAICEANTGEVSMRGIKAFCDVMKTIDSSTYTYTRGDTLRISCCVTIPIM